MTTQFIEKIIDDLMKPYNTDEIVDKFYSKIKTLTIDEVTDIVLSDIYIYLIITGMTQAKKLYLLS
ncbi:hypothetical protein [Staphylococcus delphini]|uniref:hypothetical protein n=1 Tax=Staphylococcus delphini TaxID=53344 RepID=UPI0012D318B4|nr:hypothetical protein [Staphylococcus delphini]MTV19262.1 hypothetical protein [Staphylococcus delphini]